MHILSNCYENVSSISYEALQSNIKHVLLLDSSGLLVLDSFLRTCIIPAKPGSNCPINFRGEGQNVKGLCTDIETLINGKSSHDP